MYVYFTICTLTSWTTSIVECTEMKQPGLVFHQAHPVVQISCNVILLGAVNKCNFFSLFVLLMFYHSDKSVLWYCRNVSQLQFALNHVEFFMHPPPPCMFQTRKPDNRQTERCTDVFLHAVPEVGHG